MRSQVIKMELNESTGEVIETVEYVETAENSDQIDISPIDEESETVSSDETELNEDEISSVSSSSVSVSSSVDDIEPTKSSIYSDSDSEISESGDATLVKEVEVDNNNESVASVTIEENVDGTEDAEVYISVNDEFAKTVSVITPEEEEEDSDIYGEQTEDQKVSISVNDDLAQDTHVSTVANFDISRDPENRNDVPAENVPVNEPVIDYPVVNDQKIDEEYKPEEIEIIEESSAINEDVQQTEIISDTIEELKYAKSSISKYGISPQTMMLLNMNNLLSKKAGIALPAHESLNSVGRNDEAAQQIHTALEIIHTRALESFTNKTLQIWNNTSKFMEFTTNWNKKQNKTISKTVSELKKTPWNKVTKNVYMNNINATHMQNVVNTAIKLVSVVEDVVTSGKINRTKELNAYCDQLNGLLSDMRNVKTTWYKVKGGVTTHLENINVLNNGLFKVSKKLDNIKKSSFMRAAVKTNLNKPTRDAILSVDNAVLSATKVLFKTQKLLGAATHNFNLVKKVK